FSNLLGFQTKMLHIVTQPQSRNAVRGASVSFSVSATSIRPVTYQWRFNGTNIPGAVTTILSLVNVQSGDEGSYNVVLSDGMSTVTSQSAFLAVGDRPAITVQPQSQT